MNVSPITASVKSAACSQTCPAGPPGPPGQDGAKGDSGEKGDPGINATSGIQGRIGSRNPGWCYLDKFYSDSKSKKYNYFFETLPSTSKNILVIELSTGKNYYDTLFFCMRFCGRMFLPTSQKENDELFSIWGRRGVSSKEAWIRISDEGKENIWRDVGNKALVNFTNWNSGQPNGAHDTDEDYVRISNGGKWWDSTSSPKSTVVCELL